MEESSHKKYHNQPKLQNTMNFKPFNQNLPKHSRLIYQFTEVLRERRDTNERQAWDEPSFFTVSGKEGPEKFTRKEGEGFELPKLKKYQPNKQEEESQGDCFNSVFAQSAMYDCQTLGNKEEGGKTNGKGSGRFSFSKTLKQAKQNIKQKKQYIQKLNMIRLKVGQLEKSTNGVLSKAKYAQDVINKKYGKLRQNSNSILTGVQDYYLEEERTKKYKGEIREMWMKYDK